MQAEAGIGPSVLRAIMRALGIRNYAVAARRNRRPRGVAWHGYPGLARTA